MKSNIFNNVLFPKLDTNVFDLSHDVKMSFQMGELVPTCSMEVLPGDKVKINVANMLRFAPLISPVMHEVNVTTHYFFVPNRILWAEWQDWITGNSDVDAPFVNIPVATQVAVGSLADYLGIPTGTYPEDIPINPMPFAAYTKIWDEYYRDQNLQDPIHVPLVPGDNSADYDTWLTDSPKRRAWMHDYFTAALPFAQKGDEVQIPLTTQDNIPVEYTPPGNFPAPGQLWVDRATGDPADTGGVDLVSVGSDVTMENTLTEQNVEMDPNGTYTVDVQTDATSINTLRRAFRLQEWLERNARGGTRYIENILSHFGVRSSDARLQRPQYIGGSKQKMVISEVLSTAQTEVDAVQTPVGQMAGHGISVGGGNTFSFRAEEHGWIIGLINVQPVTAYQEGLHRSFSRFSRLDYAWPTFANIGEQEVTQKEVSALVFSGGADPDTVFGYVPRYAEYKFMNSRVAGAMRTSLAFWHLGRIFGNTMPQLNEDFITCQPSNRIFAVTDDNEDHIFAHIINNVTAVRKLPRYGIPQI